MLRVNVSPAERIELRVKLVPGVVTSPMIQAGLRFLTRRGTERRLAVDRTIAEFADPHHLMDTILFLTKGREEADDQ
jgi:hypothetical protein